VLHVEAFWASPWVCATYATLREKCIPFTTATSMVRKGAGAIDTLLERTLTGMAPVLQHGNLWLAESSAIVEYLEEMFPEPRMLPAAPHDRARARQLMAWLRSDASYLALTRDRPSEHIFYPPPQRTPLSEAGQRFADRLITVITRLGADPSGALFGGRFGVVDVDLAFALMRLVTGDVPVPDPIAAYARAVWSRPLVRDFVEHQRPPHRPF